VSTGTSPNNVLFSADTNLILGRDASDVATAYSFFTGVFSFVGLFNTALDAGQIFALWNGRNAYVTNVPFPPPPPSPEQPVGFPPIPDPPLYDPPSTTTTTDLTDYWWCVARSGSQLACACSPARSPFRRLWQERRRESSHLPAAMVSRCVPPCASLRFVCACLPGTRAPFCLPRGGRRPGTLPRLHCGEQSRRRCRLLARTPVPPGCCGPSARAYRLPQVLQP
jgi:hypothetical protein